MKTENKNYLAVCEKEGKMFLQRNHNTFESMTIEEYNFRKDVEIESWEEVNDDELYSHDEVLEHFNNEEIYFL